MSQFGRSRTQKYPKMSEDKHFRLSGALAYLPHAKPGCQFMPFSKPSVHQTITVLQDSEVGIFHQKGEETCINFKKHVVSSSLRVLRNYHIFSYTFRD